MSVRIREKYRLQDRERNERKIERHQITTGKERVREEEGEAGRRGEKTKCTDIHECMRQEDGSESDWIEIVLYVLDKRKNEIEEEKRGLELRAELRWIERKKKRGKGLNREEIKRQTVTGYRYRRWISK